MDGNIYLPALTTKGVGMMGTDNSFTPFYFFLALYFDSCFLSKMEEGFNYCIYDFRFMTVDDKLYIRNDEFDSCIF